jgi:hypothetical protein
MPTEGAECVPRADVTKGAHSSPSSNTSKGAHTALSSDASKGSHGCSSQDGAGEQQPGGWYPRYGEREPERSAVQGRIQALGTISSIITLV